MEPLIIASELFILDVCGGSGIVKQHIDTNLDNFTEVRTMIWEYEKGENNPPTSLKFAKNVLETWNLLRKQKHSHSFKECSYWALGHCMFPDINNYFW